MSNGENIKELISSADATSNLTSVPLDVGELKHYSITADFSGGGNDLVGTLELEASIDNSVYVAISGSSQAVTASADHMWNVADASYRYVRVTWAYTSGTGNLSVKGYVKRNVITGA